jgi:hypothetical protein
VDPQPPVTDSDGGDEVARQREKHRTSTLSRSVPGFPALTFGQLADQAQAAAATGGGEGVVVFLADGGHDQETIEAILDCLGLDTGKETPSAEAPCVPVQASTGPRRLRTVAQLEAMLLKE